MTPLQQQLSHCHKLPGSLPLDLRWQLPFSCGSASGGAALPARHEASDRPDFREGRAVARPDDGWRGARGGYGTVQGRPLLKVRQLPHYENGRP